MWISWKVCNYFCVFVLWFVSVACNLILSLTNGSDKIIEKLPLYPSCVSQLHGAHPVGGLGLQGVVIIKEDEGGSVIMVWREGEILILYCTIINRWIQYKKFQWWTTEKSGIKLTRIKFLCFYIECKPRNWKLPCHSGLLVVSIYICPRIYECLWFIKHYMISHFLWGQYANIFKRFNSY